MAYNNNHYVPQLILRRFGEKLNRFNVQNGDIRIKGAIVNAFSSKNIYPEWLELKLGLLEAKIANLIDNKILNAENEVILTRTDIWLIKKFFTVATLRVPDTENYCAKDHESEKTLQELGFKETKIENETNEEYIIRTLNVILDAKKYEDVFKNPETTYEACKWSSLFNVCYVGIWDSLKCGEDFIITDNGMNCEHDRTRFLSFNFNGKNYFNEKDEILKNGYVIKKLMGSSGKPVIQSFYAEMAGRLRYVHANYYLFAVSNTRTISLINPFFKLYTDKEWLKHGEAPDVWPTLLTKEPLESNTQTYLNYGKKSDSDLFHYKIVDLQVEDVIILNCMMLDRVSVWMGFDETSKIAKSLSVYNMIERGFQRKHYEKLINYCMNLGVEFPKSVRYKSLANRLMNQVFTEKEMEYIKFFYDLIGKIQSSIK